MKNNWLCYECILIAVIYISFVLWGIAQARFYNLMSIQHFFNLLISATAVFWAVEDAKNRAHPIPHVLQSLMLFNVQVAVIAYLIGSRGFWGMVLVIIHATGVSLAAMFGFYTCYYFSY